jgi:hypothetical protein
VRKEDWLAHIHAHPHAFLAAAISTVVSLVLMIGGLLAVRWLLVRLPADHFVRRHQHATWVKVLRGIAAFALMAAGIAMMVLPGPGILAFLMGASLVDHPIRQRIILGILRRRHVRKVMDRLRLRAGKQPFVIPERVASPSHA